MGRSCLSRASVCAAVLLLICTVALPPSVASPAGDDRAEADGRFRVECLAEIEAAGSGVCRERFWINGSTVGRGPPELYIHDQSAFFAGAGIASNATLTWIDASGTVVFKVDCRNLVGVDVLDFSHLVLRPPAEDERPGAYPDGLPVRCDLIRDRNTFEPGRQTLQINARGSPDRLDGVHGAMDFRT